MGKKYTLSAFVRSLDAPVSVRLEVERAGSPWDRAARGADAKVGPDEWTELHLTFTVDKAYPEGWQVYLHCGQEGGRLRVDRFALYEGEHRAGPAVPSAAEDQSDVKNLLVNGSFEAGVEPWYFTWPTEQQNVRRTYRRTSFLLTRLLANMGVSGPTPLLDRLATPASGVARESVVRNGDFRLAAQGSGTPEHWQFTADAREGTCVVEPAAAAQAGASVRITCPGINGDNRGSVMLAQHDVPVQAGQWYRISLRAKATGLGRDGVTVALQNTATWQSLFDYQRFTPAEDWQEFTFLVQAKSTAAAKTRFQIWHSSAGTLWLADIRMAPCDAPTQGRWTSGLYADEPQEWDDPYRFFRW